MTRGTQRLALASAVAWLAVASCAGRGELLGSRDVADAGAGPVVDATAVDVGIEAAAPEAMPPLQDAGASDAMDAADAPVDAPGIDAAVLRTLVVAADGSAQFRTVQSAIDSIAMGSTSPVEIDVKAGTYNEKVNLVNRSFVSIVGEDPLTTTVTFTQDAVDAGGTGKSATVTILGSDFSAQNITFANGTPVTGAQAVALFVSGARQQFSNCRLISYQDTLYASAGSQYFRDCYIQGNDDYVIGGATTVFQSCTLYSASGGVAIAAPNTDPSVPYGFIFFGGALTAASSVNAGSVALGRPWGPNGSTIYVGTTLGAHIAAVGWVPFTPNDLSSVRFAEYQTTGPGADPADRADGSIQLTAGQAATLTLANLYGGWIPSFSQ